jgi:hypothetical protein
MADMIFVLVEKAPLAEVKRMLEEREVEVKIILEELGMILGCAKDDDVSKYSTLPHIQSVDLDEEVSIAPPDSPVQ